MDTLDKLTYVARWGTVYWSWAFVCDTLSDDHL